MPAGCTHLPRAHTAHTARCVLRAQACVEVRGQSWMPVLAFPVVPSLLLHVPG